MAIRTFDFTRYRPSGFNGWPNKTEPKLVSYKDLFYRFVVEPGYASYIRGVQIVRPRMSKTTIATRLDYRHNEDREYEAFIAYDWKNDVVREISTVPGATANYFTESDLPFEISPAFFRPEVLLKYKADSDKYQLRERSISCRGAWHLKTYDVNEAGQIHTYIAYLRDLPYEEQLYWKTYNEEPKAPISERAKKTDFEGRWDFEYNPLGSLREALRQLVERRQPWWMPRSEGLPEQVNYPVTTSADEWANEILQLDQLVVEGFEEKWLRAKAKSLGMAPEPQFGSLKLVEQCLIGLDFENERAQEIAAPFRELHHLRTKLKGHASGHEATTIKRDVLSKHQSYGQHFRALCARCDESIRVINEAFAGLS